MDLASQACSRQCQHHERFCQSWLECPEVSAHINGSTVSDHFVWLDPGVTVSGRDPLGCQNSVDSTTRDQILQNSYLQSPFDFAHEGQN